MIVTRPLCLLAGARIISSPVSVVLLENIVITSHVLPLRCGDQLATALCGGVLESNAHLVAALAKLIADGYELLVRQAAGEARALEQIVDVVNCGEDLDLITRFHTGKQAMAAVRKVLSLFR